VRPTTAPWQTNFHLSEWLSKQHFPA
jgi:hypothetical protein